MGSDALLSTFGNDPLHFLSGYAMCVRLFHRARRFRQRLKTPGQRQSSTGESGERHSDHASDETRCKSVARISRNARFAVDKTLAASADIHLLQVLAAERPALFKQLDDGLAQLRSRRPRLIYARTCQHIGTAGSLTDARVAIASENRFAVSARFLQGLRTPRLQRSAMHVAPQIRM